MSARDEFEGVYDTFFPKIYAYFSVCFNDDIADDLSQQVFLKIWKKMCEAGFCVPDEWKAWIFRIAVNTKNDFLRKKYRQPQFVELQPEELIDTEWNAKNAEDRILIEKAIELLTINDKELLLLRGNGFNSNEIGDVLGVPSSTVRSRIATAKRRFRKYLDIYGVTING